MPANENMGSPRKLTAKVVYLMVLSSMPVLLIFAYLGDVYRGIGASVCTTTVLIVVRARWDLRKHIWFWVTVTLTLVFQIPFVFLVPWKNRNVNGVTILPLMLLDYGMVFGCVKLAQMMMKKAQPPDEAHPSSE